MTGRLGCIPEVLPEIFCVFARVSVGDAQPGLLDMWFCSTCVPHHGSKSRVRSEAAGTLTVGSMGIKGLARRQLLFEPPERYTQPRGLMKFLQDAAPKAVKEKESQASER